MRSPVLWLVARVEWDGHTGVKKLTEAGVGREEQDEVVERNGTDQIQQEPRPHVAASYLVRLQDYLVRKIIRYYTYKHRRKNVHSDYN